jgi:hypothetical protein
MAWLEGGSPNDRIRWSEANQQADPALVWSSARVLGDRRTSHVPAITGTERILDDRRTSGAPALGGSDRGEAVMVWRGAADSVLWWSRYSALEWDPQYYPFADRQTDVWHGVGLA